jgi:hypothetical protein
MKTHREDMHTERASSETNNEATGLVTDGAFDREAIALSAYFYWEARGRPHDSPHEDWFKAEAEICNRLGATAIA